jgi:hypothetical protein
MPFVGPTFAELQMQQQQINNQNEQEAIRSAMTKWQDVKNRQSKEVDSVLNGKYAGDYVAMSNSSDAPLLKSFLNGIVPQHDQVMQGLQEGLLTDKYVKQSIQQMHDAGIIGMSPDTVKQETKTQDISYNTETPKTKFKTISGSANYEQNKVQDEKAGKIKALISKATTSQDYIKAVNDTYGAGTLEANDLISRFGNKPIAEIKSAYEGISSNSLSPGQQQTAEILAKQQAARNYVVPTTYKETTVTPRTFLDVGVMNSGEKYLQGQNNPKIVEQAKKDYSLLSDTEKKSILEASNQQGSNFKDQAELESFLNNAKTVDDLWRVKLNPNMDYNFPESPSPGQTSSQTNQVPTTTPKSNGTINSNENSNNPTAQPSTYTQTSQMVPTGTSSWKYTPELEKELARGNKALSYMMNRGYKKEVIDLLNQGQQIAADPKLEITNPYILDDKTLIGLKMRNDYEQMLQEAKLTSRKLDLEERRLNNAEATDNASKGQAYYNALKDGGPEAIKARIGNKQALLNSINNSDAIVGYNKERQEFMDKAKYLEDDIAREKAWKDKVIANPKLTQAEGMMDKATQLTAEIDYLINGTSTTSSGTTGTSSSEVPSWAKYVPK